MSLLSVINSSVNKSSSKSTYTQHQDNNCNTGGNNSLFGLGTIFTPVKNTVSAVSSILNLFPDPTKEGTLYDQLNSAYNQAAHTLIEVPKTITSHIPGLNLVGDLLSSAVSATLKDVGIVGDHFIMIGAEVVDAVDVTLVGSANIIDKFLKNPTDLASIISDYNTDSVDSLTEVVSHILSYAVNNAESHLYHDVDLAASPVDLIVALTKDIENNTGFKVPGSDILNKIIDGLAVTLQDKVSGETFDQLRKLLSDAGLKITNVGTMNHETMDHVGEGNIREGYDRDHSGHSGNGSANGHEHSGNGSSNGHEHSGNGSSNGHEDCSCDNNDLLGLLNLGNIIHTQNTSDTSSITQATKLISDLLNQVSDVQTQGQSLLDSLVGNSSLVTSVSNNITNSSDSLSIPLHSIDFNHELLNSQAYVV